LHNRFTAYYSVEEPIRQKLCRI